MSKRHLKRIAAPPSWTIHKKENTFITRPNPGRHSFSEGMPVTIIFKNLLKYAETTAEVKKILQNNEVVVDGSRVKDPSFLVGLMDTFEIKNLNQKFRMLVNSKGKLTLTEITKGEANIKPCKIIGKTIIKGGKTQINLFDSRNILVDKDNYNVGDTVVITLPQQTIKEHIKFENGSFIFLTGGRHIGDSGIIEDMKDNKIRYMSKSGEKLEVLKKFAFVLGKEKPVISLS
jgi:small subunit ribosomal protein S4e